MLLFFGMFYFGTLHSVLICVVHNYLCVWLHFFLHSGFLCAITCLPYLLQWFCASHFGFFFVPKCSLFCFLLFCRFFSVPLPRCFVFLAAQFASFCALGYFWVLCHANVFFLRCCSFFCCLFFAHLCDCFFFFYNLWPSLTYLCILVLLFRLVSPFLFLIFRYVNALIASILPLTAFLFLPLALPATTINIGQHVAFFYPVHTSQNMSC